MAAISGEQVAVYDRQLRLWGVQAQTRLLNAKVLVWGLEGVSVEVCKNLVLAGVSLTIRDHRPVSAADVGFNYFLRPEDLGKPRSTCAASRVQEMNPLCKVSSSEAPVDQGTLRESIKGFDVVITGLGVLGFDFDKAAKIDAACREAGACFMLTISAGELAFFFSDLNEHVMQERSSPQGAEQGGPTKPPEAETFSFPLFSEWLTCTPEILKQQKCDTSFQLIALFAGFLRSGGKASASAASDFEAYCRDTAKCLPDVDGVEGGVKQAFGHFFVEPLIHVASVLAGLLSQEVIKAITRKDPPLVNCVCFNAHTCAGLVERLPAAKAVVKKRKAEEEVADLLDDD